MNIKKISLCQNEKWNYDIMPRNLNTDYMPIYDFIYPFSYEIALDCERIVFTLKEKGITSEICFHLNVAFINESGHTIPELMDFTAFGIKGMRFVNIYLNADEFNEMTNEQKRYCILKKISEAAVMITESNQAEQIEEVIRHIYKLSSETECLFLEKQTVKYHAMVRYRSSMDGYTAILYLKNNVSEAEKKQILFQNLSFADLVYKIHKIKFKQGKCIICPKDYSYIQDEDIVVELDI